MVFFERESLSEFMRTMTRSHRRYASEFCFYGFRKEFVILTCEYRKFPRNFNTGKHYEIFSRVRVELYKNYFSLNFPNNIYPLCSSLGKKIIKLKLPKYLISFLKIILRNSILSKLYEYTIFYSNGGKKI